MKAVFKSCLHFLKNHLYQLSSLCHCSSSGILSMTTGTSHCEEGLDLQLPLAQHQLGTPVCRAQPGRDLGRASAPLYSRLMIKVKFCTFFVCLFQTLQSFLRVASGKGKGSVFVDLLDIWGFGMSLEFTEFSVLWCPSPLALSSCLCWFPFALLCVAGEADPGSVAQRLITVSPWMMSCYGIFQSVYSAACGQGGLLVFAEIKQPYFEKTQMMWGHFCTQWGKSG